jgi:hypothetical protein
VSDYTTFRDPRESLSAQLVRAIAARPAGLTVQAVMDIVSPGIPSRRVSAMLHKMAVRGVLRKSQVLRPGTERVVSLFTVANRDRRARTLAPLPSLIRAYMETHGPCTVEQIAHAVHAPMPAVRTILHRMRDGEEVQITGPANQQRYELAPLEDLPDVPYVSAVRARALGLKGVAA